MEDSELLLLVDDEEPQVVELDVLLDEPVRADDDVDLALGDAARARRFCSLGGPEPGENVDLDRVVGESVA